MSKLSLTLHTFSITTFSITGLVASLFLTLRAFRTINSTYKYSIFPLPEILILGDIWIYVGFTNSINVASNIEAPFNQYFGIGTTLRVSDIHLYNSYIRLGRCFDDSRTRKSDVVNMNNFENTFHSIGRDREFGIFNKVWDNKNFQVRFWLRKPVAFNTVIINGIHH